MTTAADVKTLLANTLWLGGATGSGKSSVAAALAARHGWHVYAGDVEERESHLKRITPERHPYFARFMSKSMDERWVDSTPEQLLQDMPAYHGESLALIVEDLLEGSYEGTVLVEGHHFMPAHLAPYLSRPDQACWLLATPGFRARAFEMRGNMWRMPNETRDPARAMVNRLRRDALYANVMATEAANLGLPGLEVHGQPLEDVVQWVEAQFHAHLRP